MTMTEMVPRVSRGPTIRLRPAPPSDPPFDDELPPDVWAPPDQLAFDFPSGSDGGVAVGTASASGRGPEAAGGRVPDESAGVVGTPAEPTASGEPAAGDARRAVRRFVQLAVEVLNGHRPAAQLRRLAHPMEASKVVAQAITGAHRVNQLRRTAQVSRPSPVGVRGVRLCEPRRGAVEAAVLLETGQRTWAMALRLELHHETWTATVLRLI